MLSDPKKAKDEEQIFGVLCCEKSLMCFRRRLKSTIYFPLSLGSERMFCTKFLKNPWQKSLPKVRVPGAAFPVYTSGKQLVSLLSRLAGEVEKVLSGEQLILLIVCNASGAPGKWERTQRAAFPPHILQDQRHQLVL